MIMSRAIGVPYRVLSSRTYKLNIVIMSKRPPHLDEKCQHKASHVSSMNDEETLTPKGRLQLAPKQHYTQVQRNSCPYILQQHKSKHKSENETILKERLIMAFNAEPVFQLAINLVKIRTINYSIQSLQYAVIDN